MAGAIDALEAGSALLNEEGRIVSCCKRFSQLTGVPISDVVGRRGRELVHPEDRDYPVALAARLWRSGEPFTVMFRASAPERAGQVLENRVQLLHGKQSFILSILRPFRGNFSPSKLSDEMLTSMSSYVVEMAGQLADMAAGAAMPVTSDLLQVSVAAGLQEVALGIAGRRAN